jgi:hypothetical protein
MEPHISSTDRWMLSFLKRLLPRFEKYENSLSIIIQGPLNSRSINTIPNYLKYGNVIVSCWDTDNLSLLDPYKDKIKIIINQYEKVKSFAFRNNQRNPCVYQFYTTYNALKESNDYLAIKVRSDESYPILDPLINVLKNNRDNIDENHNWFKIVTSNIYFRYDNQFKFHPSDHIVAGLRSRMKDIYEACLFKCKYKNIKNLSPEQILGTSTIETYFDPILKTRLGCDPNNSFNLMKKHFDIIRISSLPNRVWTSSYRKYEKLTSEEDWCHNINDLKNRG